MNETVRCIVRWLVRAHEEGLRTHQAILRLLSRVSAVSLLDVGCADGTTAEGYARFLSIPLNRVKGIEAKDHYASEASKRFQVYQIDIEKECFPVRDEEFDLIVCNQVLEHIKNIYRPLAEMDRTLRTHGFLLIGVPNLAGLYNRFLLLMGIQPLAITIDGPHVRGFAHSDFLEFLKQNKNFEILSTDSSNLYPLPYPLIEWCGGHFISFSSYTFYLLRKKMHNPAGCGWKPRPALDTCF